jgi:hypothetical protein
MSENRTTQEMRVELVASVERGDVIRCARCGRQLTVAAARRAQVTGDEVRHKGTKPTSDCRRPRFTPPKWRRDS